VRTIEVLYFDGCPNHQPLVERLPHLLARERIEAHIVLRRVVDAEEAEREGFLGSPTVRIDGHDIEAGSAERRDFGLKCRVYRTSSGLAGLPPDELILEALLRR
jgi:hypothetical protein